MSIFFRVQICFVFPTHLFTKYIAYIYTSDGVTSNGGKFGSIKWLYIYKEYLKSVLVGILLDIWIHYLRRAYIVSYYWFIQRTIYPDYEDNSKQDIDRYDLLVNVNYGL